jgi:glutaredoxin
MKKNISLFILAIVIVAVIVGSVFWVNYQKQQKATSIPKSQMIFFYGDGCPHCAKVEKFIKDNNILQKFKLQEKDITGDRINLNLLIARAKVCGIKDVKQIGIPFLWTGSKCIVGDKPVIAFLSKK